MYFNGEHINGKKTFKKKSWYRGFKKGDGQYKEFLFRVNEFGHQGLEDFKSQQIKEETTRNRHKPYMTKFQELRSEMENKHKGKFGTIIIEFYKTEKFKKQHSQGGSAKMSYLEYEDKRREKNKKSIVDMTIKEGNSFHIDPNKYHPPNPRADQNGIRKRSRSRDRERDR